MLEEPNAEKEMPIKKKKAEDFSSAFSGLYPPPGTLPNYNLLQRRAARLARRPLKAAAPYRTTPSAAEQK